MKNIQTVILIFIHIAGACVQDVIHTLIPAMLSLQKTPGKLKLRPSPKEQIVSSNPKLTCLLHQQLSANRLHSKRIKQARDLGISNASGNNRLDLLMKQRLNRSRTRTLKISELAKSFRKAGKLFTGFAFSIAAWCHQAAAISEQQHTDLEQSALACSGLHPAGSAGHLV